MTFGVQMKIAQMEKINKSKMFEMDKKLFDMFEMEKKSLKWKNNVCK